MRDRSTTLCHTGKLLRQKQSLYRDNTRTRIRDFRQTVREFSNALTEILSAITSEQSFGELSEFLRAGIVSGSVRIKQNIKL